MQDRNAQGREAGASRHPLLRPRVRMRACALLLGLAAPAALLAQDSTAFYRALDLEGAGKYTEAAPLFRSALHGPNGASALLGLERVYSELGQLDSLLAPVDTLVRRNPHETVYRTVQLRTLQTLGRDAELRAAVDRWVQDAPGDPSPFREYARLLLQRGLTASADSVIRRAREVLGSTGDLQLEIAQLRAAMGLWQESAQAWRLALATAPYLQQSAVYALTPTPDSARAAVRTVLLAAPTEVGARRALAGLEMAWGSAADGWKALRDLPVDSASAAAWMDFASRAEADERWTLARDALMAALRWKRTPELTLRAAQASLGAGDPAAALALLPLTGSPVTDSAALARAYVPVQTRALAMLGRPSDAEHLIAAYHRWLTPGARTLLSRTVAMGWVRSGDLARARASLTAAGPDADSSDAAGWIALYEGKLGTARPLLRSSPEATPQLASALAIVSRIRGDSAPVLGRAFLALARGDSVAAAAGFVDAAEQQADARSILLSTAAQLYLARHDEARALALWKRIVEHEPQTPEAPNAELEWARALRRQGDTAGAVAHLEHMILTYPGSALVPQARRELELARGSIPQGGTT